MQAVDERTQLAVDLQVVWMHLMRSSGSELYALIDRHQLSLSHIKALYSLADADGPSVKELAQALALSLPATSRLADVLLKRGLLTRREDDVDRRMKRLAITDEGRALLAELDAVRLAGLEQFTASLDTEDRRRLGAALAPIAERLR